MIGFYATPLPDGPLYGKLPFEATGGHNPTPGQKRPTRDTDDQLWRRLDERIEGLSDEIVALGKAATGAQRLTAENRCFVIS